LQYTVGISLEEAARGTEKEIPLTRIEYCADCQGTGAKPGSQPVKCPECNGSGQVRRTQQSVFGRFTNVATCPRCRGEGRIITDPCPRCHGTGRERKQRTIPVKIPAGIASNMQIRVRGEGNSGYRGGPAGDLLIGIEVREHELFVRDGDDILINAPINFAQAALGTELEVPTLEGPAKVKIPSGTQTGSVFKLKGKGMPRLNEKGHGDELVTVKVITPESLTKEQKQLLEQLSESLGMNKKR
ncbi:MAG TPA: DnaJ C-terminal domain-containing protein, partial [Dehalococcoidales bacterium]|nr:DnaJ C-terminal domain-containing protein [Dehalococcoidales bacterium]